jgi:pimeloyl-ACP methyl ester carboxylesterase
MASRPRSRKNTAPAAKKVLGAISRRISSIESPDFVALYDRAAKQTAAQRNPVIVIPGILGSRLVDRETGTPIWGSFDDSFADPSTPEGARMTAFDMSEGAALADLDGRADVDGALEKIRGKVLGLPVELSAYNEIILTLGAGGYTGELLGANKVLDYGVNALSTCFQFPYDWRRSIPENAAKLDEFVQAVLRYARREAGCAHNVKVDIVAHSMGGILARYFVAYGGADAPCASASPCFAGAKDVEHLVMVGTPNAGSLEALRKLKIGLPRTPLTPSYSAQILATFPSMYQLLPRGRHGHVWVEERDRVRRVDDLLDLDLWERMSWGLADAAADEELAKLLPGEDTVAKRRVVAIDHLGKCLDEARRVQAALDAPAPCPPDLKVILFAGDAKATPSLAVVGEGAKDALYVRTAAGDGTVLRSSALMDERVGNDWVPRVQSPIDWTQVVFLHTDHMGLTRSPTFTDNLLYLLLERPRGACVV